jgi:hypothetical protein
MLCLCCYRACRCYGVSIGVRRQSQLFTSWLSHGGVAFEFSDGCLGFVALKLHERFGDKIWCVVLFPIVWGIGVSVSSIKRREFQIGL